MPSPAPASRGAGREARAGSDLGELEEQEGGPHRCTEDGDRVRDRDRGPVVQDFVGLGAEFGIFLLHWKTKNRF